MTVKKKILQVCNSDFYLARFLRPLLLALVDAGFEVHVATDGENIPDCVHAACVVHQMNFPKDAKPAAFIASIKALRTLIRCEAFDCVNSHNRNASMVARLAAWLEKTPVNLYTAHGFYFHDDQSALARALTIGLEALLARVTDHTLSQSQEDRELMTRWGLIPPDQIETIGNGIDTRKFSVDEPRAVIESRLGLTPGVFRIVSVGRVVQGKGFADLANAFARFLRAGAEHMNSELLIVGGNIDADINPALDELHALLRKLGIADKVAITGLVDNVEDYLYVSDIFVSSSYREGMPRAVLEAMCSGLPVVATAIRGSREVVIPGENGYLYPAHNVDACAAAIGQLSMAPTERKEMGRRGRRLVLEKYTEEAYIRRQVSAIESLSARKTR